jgi:hypothetical protein
VNLEDQSSAVTDGVGIILEVGFVGGSDLNQFRPGSLENLRDTESTPNFYQFPSANYHLVLFRGDQGPKGEHKSCGAIIDRGSSLGLQENGKCGFEVARPLSPFSVQEVEFEVGVSRGNLAQGFRCTLAERRSTEVGMDDNSCGVDYRLKPRRRKILKATLDLLFDGSSIGSFSFGESCAPLRETAFDKARDERARKIALPREALG